jgi:WD40 repeat protein
VWSVAFSPDGKRVVSGSSDCTVRIWDAGTGKLVAGPFEGHTNFVWSVAFSPDGQRVVSGSHDHTVRIWDAETGTLVAGPFEGHTDKVWSVAFSPDGLRVVSGSSDRTIRTWDAGTGQTVAGPLYSLGTTPTTSSTFPHSRQKVTSNINASNTIARVWDVKTGQVITFPFAGHTDTILSDTSSRDVTLRIKDSKTGPFRTLSGFLGRDAIRGGWVRCSNLVEYDVLDQGLLFWVPETCRQAVCGPEMLFVFRKRTTRLDLGRFAHGAAWMQCRSSHVSCFDSSRLC